MNIISITKQFVVSSGAGDGFKGTDAVQTHMTNSLLTDTLKY